MRIAHGDVPAELALDPTEAQRLAEIGRTWRNYLAAGALGPDLFFLLPDFKNFGGVLGVHPGAMPGPASRRTPRGDLHDLRRTIMPGPWTPTSALGSAVYAAGFLYDPDQDIIYTRMDALQRGFGYAFGYDAAALGINAVLDCEPIFFDYDGRHWMIELWKGQYGLETGCEIGVYTRLIGSAGAGYALLDATVGQRPGDGVPSHNLFYAVSYTHLTLPTIYSV